MNSKIQINNVLLGGYALALFAVGGQKPAISAPDSVFVGTADCVNSPGGSRATVKYVVGALPPYRIVRAIVDARFFPDLVNRRIIIRTLTYSTTLTGQTTTGFAQQSVIVLGEYAYLAVLPNGFPSGGLRRKFGSSAECIPSPKDPNNAGGGGGTGGGGGGGTGGCVSSYSNNYCADISSLVVPSSVIGRGTIGLNDPSVPKEQPMETKKPDLHVGEWQGQSWKPQDQS